MNSKTMKVELLKQKFYEKSGVLAKGILVLLLTWLLWLQYAYGFDSEMFIYKDFQIDSDQLVTDVVNGQLAGIPSGEYGLGNIVTSLVLAEVGDDLQTISFLEDAYSLPFLTEESVLIVDGTERYQIEKVEAGIDVIVVTLERPVEDLMLGQEDRLQIEQNGTLVELRKMQGYVSQVGLQGMVYTMLTPLFGHSSVGMFRYMCVLAMVLAVMLICSLIAVRFSVLLSACFYLVFLTSPWIVNFAGSVYWVEFTWFIPMALGLLYCIDPKRYKLWSVFVFVALFVKCLCGFEYVSTVLVGMMLFPAFVWAMERRTLAGIKELICLSLAGVAGFVAAFLCLAVMRGGGDVFAGVQVIYTEDVLRRTYGGSYSFDPLVAASLEAKPLDVLVKYFKFGTSLMVGIDGDMFVYLAILPLVTALVNLIRKKKVDWDVLVLYLLAFLAALSWFVLAKGHSDIHTHISFVLWYFGFVQICFYSLARLVLNVLGQSDWDKPLALCAQSVEKEKAEVTA